ncbi:threonine dehydrogenase-like Zn-dependent dehydrogenase [Actinoalloteichus hoggarensis]|uniref:L-threonine 3-dehydrogenase n=1 Tax=Actinoalloteichus hoggarensis TaxID=1470176 RepID=A0A221W311_9PSEU|nr:zinc-binding dehydrogenase [Actinoalloteichus hoggarensis]ASO20165.1 L-threonine 3-dehydrogenase [Actinoalloteichus hoggarensis]MBB5919122.1 threonine dehydrogenase-like Zn-dependent dehydrogenase [Actinoalloteichus hoggarensis]
MSGTAVPATMRGVYLPGDSTAVIKEIPVPEPGPGQLLLRVGASGICGSDIGYIYREHKTHRGVDGPAYRGVVTGHEPSGVVVAAGPGCREYGVGDRVIVYHIAGCMTCDNCRRGYQISCTGAARAAYGWQRDGGNADYILVEETTCVRLPDELSYVDGALIACGFGTAYEGLRRVAVSGEDDLLVVGLGPVGLAAAMIGRGMGARRIIGVEPSARRRAWADGLDLFDATVGVDAPGEAIAELTAGRGTSTAIDCSGSRAGRGTAVENTAEWGRVSLVGEGGTLETEVSDTLLHKQLTLHASWVTSVPAMARLAGNLVRWGVRPEVVVSERLPLAEADAAYRLAAGAGTGKVCLVADDMAGS